MKSAERYESWIWLHRTEDLYGYSVKDRVIDQVVARSFELKDFAATEHDLEVRLARLRNPQ